MMINLGALEPDRAGVDTGLLTIARNCYPTTIGWGPMPTLSEYGSNALPSACLGLAFARQATGGYEVFAGTTTKLYKLVSGTWTDYTRTVGGNYATAAGNYWRFHQWGTLLMAVNGSDAPQVIDLSSGATKFQALAGSPPTAKFISGVGDFVFLVDATNLRRAMNCGTTGPNTATSWTVGTDLCDEYIAPDGGNISCAPMLGEYGLVLQDDGIGRRVILQPGDTTSAFRFEKLEGIKGAISGYSCVAANSKIYYLAQDGIYSLGPDGQNAPVGSQRINAYFLADMDPARIEQTLAFADPFSTRIYWAYYATSSATVFNRLLGYDWQQDRFFFASASAAFWAAVAVPGMTTEQVSAIYTNLDTMPVSLDSRQFQGSRPTLGAVNSSGKLALLSGLPDQATIDVSAVQLLSPNRALLTEIEVRGDIGSASVELWVGKRENSSQGASISRGPFVPSSETGIAYPRVSGRLHDIELRLSGNWHSVQALATREIPDGKR